MNKNLFEIIIGSLVLIIAIYFISFAVKKSEVNIQDSYLLNAKFDNAQGIVAGSDIRVSGVKIGSVVDLKLDNHTYQAEVVLSIYDDIKLPGDSSAKIVSDGLLGNKHISIEPGAEEENLKNGNKIEFTQSSVNLEELLSKFIFSSANDD